MSVGLHTNSSSFEIGTSDFFRSFFDTIDHHLTKGLFARKYPAILDHLQQGHLQEKDLDKARKELEHIRQKLKKYTPQKLIWDKYDLSQRPPWGGEISSGITDLSNYFITSEGLDLFDVLTSAIDREEQERSDLWIR